jgi:predicted ATPase
MQVALEEHDELVRAVVRDHGGTVFAGGGDGFGAVFSDPTAAVSAALVAQERSVSLAVGEDSLPIRMGLHTGNAQERGGDYFGLAVNRAARVASAANGGQVLLTSSTAPLVDGGIELIELGTHRLADLLEPVTIWQAGPGSFPPIRALDPDHHNLPVRFTSVVGREALVESVAHSLAADRLVTLVGPGGIGKTTVALEVGAAIASEADRGVWLVELDELDQQTVIDHHIASVLGLSPIEGWHRTAARRDHVLLLDNAEHLLDEVAEAVAGLLRSGPSIRFLVTSREPLGIPGETVVEVSPLDTTDEGTRLLLDRASSIEGGPDDLARLVKMTDGLPLAIELVAAHAARVSVPDLVTSLEQYGVGSLEARGVGTRHRSSHAAVEWSLSLLSPTEQEAFNALSVFAQDFTQEGAVAVSATSPLTFRSLVEKSLVQRSAGRYRLLEPIKEVAATRLQAMGAADEVRRRHAHYVADHIERLARRLPPRPAEGWLDALTISLSDFGRAAVWAVDESDVTTLERLNLAMPGPYGIHLSELAVLVDVLEPFVAHLVENLPTTRWLLFRHAWCEDAAGREPEAREKALMLRDVGEEMGDDALVAAATFLFIRANGMRDATIDEFEEAISVVQAYEGKTEWWEQSTLVAMKGRHRAVHGDLEGAEHTLREALNIPFRTEFNRLITLADLAETLADAGRPAEALGLWDDISRSDDLLPDLRYQVLQGTAHAHVALHQPERARSLIEQMVDEDLKERQPTSAAFCAVADYHREIGDHRAAVWFLAKMLGDRPPHASVHHRIIEQARTKLGDDFDVEWRRGANMDIFALYGLIKES